MSLLLWGFVVAEKQERGGKRAGASLVTGVRLGALNEARNLTQPHTTSLQPQRHLKKNMKNHFLVLS
jgi:hypothetical protein